MSDEPEPPPATIITDFHPAVQLTRAVADRREIRFELLTPPHKSTFDFIDDLRDRVQTQRGSAPESPISVHEVKGDWDKVVVVYKPLGKRNLRQDMRDMVRIFAEMDVPITDKVREGMRHAFDVFKALNAQGHAATETARRSAKEDPRGRGPR